MDGIRRLARCLSLVLALALAVMGLPLAAPVSAAVPTTGNGASDDPSISGDGRLVAFSSSATDLVVGDTNGATDVFVRDLSTGVTSLVSVGVGGAAANGGSAEPTLSNDGRFVAFTSGATNLVTQADSNGSSDIFVRDLVSGSTALVSVSSASGPPHAANGPSSGPSISGSGRYVAFRTLATDAVGGDTNGVSDVILRDLQTAAVVRVSRSSKDVPGNGASAAPVVSTDGRFVAFQSAATNLAGKDRNGRLDVFRYAVATGKNAIVSRTYKGRLTNGDSGAASISGDGSKVAFVSAGTNLVTGDTNAVSDVFVRNLTSSTTVRVSVTSASGQANGGSAAPSLSSDGNRIAFESQASNLVTGDTNEVSDVFIRDLLGSATIRISLTPGGAQANGASTSPSAATDGSKVAFASLASNLASTDGNGRSDVFRRDTIVATTDLVSVAFGDTTPPPMPSIDSHPADPTNLVGAEFAFSDAESGVSFRCDLDGVGYEDCVSPVSYSGIAEGQHEFSVKARDAALNDSDAATFNWTVDLTPPPAPILLSFPADPTPQTDASFTFSDDEEGVTFRCRLDEAPWEDCVSPYEVAGPLTDGAHTFYVRALDLAGNMGPIESYAWVVDTDGLPPDPQDVAPPVDQTVPTVLSDSVRFLYEGADPIQTGVEPGAVDESRVVVVRGLVTDRSGQPVPGVRVSLLDHPELGQTLTRVDGRFDLVGNGGGTITLDYRIDGSLPVQRTLEAPPSDYLVAPDVVLTALDPVVTTIDIGASEYQVAEGSEQTDADGTRQAVLLFPPDTHATMTLPDGSQQALESLDVRATEFTVGPQGPEAMPGELPPSSAYTYAVDLTVDQALQAGATRVTFDAAVPVYVDNFLGFDAGTIVPTGYYDLVRGAWIPSANGLVIDIVGIVDGAATLDLDGDGLPDSATVLASHGITDEERASLSALYAPGDSVWRTPVRHFTPLDHNWGPVPPDDAVFPDVDPWVDDEPQEPTCRTGSIIYCEDQTLGERIPVAGTPFALNYRSRRAPGYQPGRTIRIPLTGPSVAASLQRVLLEVRVGGRLFERSFAADTNLTTDFLWDGRDAYGRRMVGSFPVEVRVGYEYPGRYLTYLEMDALGWPKTGLFAIAPPAGAREATLTREDFVYWQTSQLTVQSVDRASLGLGGWTLSPQHLIDPGSMTLLRGDGSDAVAPVGVRPLHAVRENRCWQPKADGATGPDGSLYFVDECDLQRFLVQILPDGSTRTFPDPIGNRVIDVGSDGSVYLLEGFTLTKMDPDGNFSFVTSADCSNPSNDILGMVAHDVCLLANDATVGPDGSIYVATDWSPDRFTPRGGLVVKIGTDGVIRPLAGNGSFPSPVPPCEIMWWCPPEDGAIATDVPLIPPDKVALASDGSALAVIYGDVYRIDPYGRIFRVFDGNRASRPYPEANDVAGGPDGSVYVIGSASPDGDGARVGVVYRLWPTGEEEVVAGSTQASAQSIVSGFPQGTPATGVQLPPCSPYQPCSMEVMANGSLMMESTFYDSAADEQVAWFGRVGRFTLGDSGVVDPSGNQVYVLDRSLRHTRTVDALTGATIYDLGYDAQGRLASVTDRDGNVTTIEHDAQGPTAIVGPYGERTELTVDANGYLSSIAGPTGRVDLTTSDDGLLTELVDIGGGVHTFTYNGSGRLIRDRGPGVDLTLDRTRSTGADGSRIDRVSVTTGLGHVTTYRTVERPGVTERTITDDARGTTVHVQRSDGSVRTTHPSGTIERYELAPDPRWGMLAPNVASYSVERPSGATSTLSFERHVQLVDPDDLFTVERLTDTVASDGDSATTVYDAASNTVTWTSPEGRQATATYDSLGHMSAFQREGLTPSLIGYDTKGRVETWSLGSSSTAYAYDARGRLIEVTDGSGRTTTYGYDDADRVTNVVLPGSTGFSLSYNASGDLTEIVMPSGSIHTLGREPDGSLSSYTPPGGSQTTYAYNADGRKTTTVLPSHGTVTESYDAAGRHDGLNYPEADVDVAFVPGTDQVEGVTRTSTEDGTSVGVVYTHDGALITEMQVAGSVHGRFAYTYDNQGRMTSITHGTDQAIAVTYDADNLVTAYGSFSFARGGPSGAPTEITDGTAQITMSYDDRGRLAGRAVSVAGVPVFGETLTYRDDGFVAGRSEMSGGSTAEYAYGYEPSGQLTSVALDSVTVESYDYDPNGNRTSQQRYGSPVTTASFDEQDRLQSLGEAGYAFDESGFLSARGSDSFRYSSVGELLEARVGGETVTYRYDGFRRMVSRTDAVGTTEYLYADLSRPFQVTDVRLPNGSRMVLHYDESSRLIALDLDGARFYVATDMTGTPRVVTNVSGSVVKVLSYDSFGRELSDSAPGFFLPVGFQGGISDPITHLVRFGLRDYDPEAGRWTAKDPVVYAGGDINLYRFVGNNPVVSRDPAGTWEWSDVYWATDRALGGYLDATVETGKEIGYKLLELTVCLGGVLCAEVGPDGPGATIGVDKEFGPVDVKAECAVTLTEEGGAEDPLFHYEVEVGASDSWGLFDATAYKTEGDAGKWNTIIDLKNSYYGRAERAAESD